MTRDELIEKIRKVEALFKSTQSLGEIQAARMRQNASKPNSPLHLNLRSNSSSP